MHDSIKFWTLFAVVAVAILVVGWKQPLRYRFMTKQEIASINAPEPTPPPKGAWMWDTSKRGSKLDHGGYDKRSARSDGGMW
jgi:hypothetical protein